MRFLDPYIISVIYFFLKNLNKLHNKFLSNKLHKNASCSNKLKLIFAN